MQNILLVIENEIDLKYINSVTLFQEKNMYWNKKKNTDLIFQSMHY